MAARKSVKKSKTGAKSKAGSFYMGLGLACCLGVAGGYLYGNQMWTKNRAAKLAAALGTMPGVSVTQMGGTVSVAGQVGSIQEYNQIRMTVRGMNAGGCNCAMNMVTLTDEGKEALITQLKKEIRNRRVKVHFLGERLVLEGMVRNDYEADKAVEMAKAALLLGANGSTRETAAVTEGNGMTAENYMILDMLRVRGR